MSGGVIELVLTTLDRRTPGRALAEVIGTSALPEPRPAEDWSGDVETCERLLLWLKGVDVVSGAQIAEWQRIVADHTPISASDPCPTCGPVCEPTWQVQRRWAKDMLAVHAPDGRDTDRVGGR